MADVRTMSFELPGFGGELVHPDDAAYDDTRAVFNGMIDRKPALIARCTSADDVVAAATLLVNRACRSPSTAAATA